MAAAIRWVDPSYIAIYHVLTNPVYAGAYAYGKSRHEVTLDATGRAQEARTQAAAIANGPCSSRTTMKASSTGHL